MRHRDQNTAALLARVVTAVELHAKRTERRKRTWPVVVPTEQVVRDRLREVESRVDPAGPFDPALSAELDDALIDVEQLEGA